MNIAFSARAADTNAEPAPIASLFYTAAEVKAIEGLRRKNPQAEDQSVLHLGAVIYYGPDDWIVWLQGSRWTPETDRPDLHIADVQPNLVRVSWTATPGAAPLDITLHPHQTYRPAAITADGTARASPAHSGNLPVTAP